MQLVFNELSANGMYENSYSANEGMKRLVYQFKQLADNHNDQLIMPRNFRELKISETDNYTIGKWCLNINIDRDIRIILGRYIDKAPYLEDFEQNLNVDYYYHDLRCAGLGKAFELDTFAMSLDCDTDFCISPFIFEKYIINAEYKTSIEPVSVLNIYSENQIEHIVKHIKNAELNNASTGEALLAYIASGMKHLRLTADAQNAITVMNGKEPYFSDVRKHLAILNQAIDEYQPGSAFNPLTYGIKWSPESEATLNLYGAERTFLCSDGIRRIFSNHTKINTDAWRIYFEADLEKRIVIIGCITKHLRTASEN